MILASLILAAAAETPEILGVRCQRVGSAATIRVLATAPVGEVASERNGDAVVFLIPATVTLEGLPVPEPIAPVRSLALESGPALTRLRVSTAPNTRVESRADGSLLTFSFQSPERGSFTDASVKSKGLSGSFACPANMILAPSS